MTLRLGNILPGHTATIKMTMIEPLEIVAGNFAYSLPVSFYPNYLNHGVTDEKIFGYEFGYEVVICSDSSISFISVPKGGTVQENEDRTRITAVGSQRGRSLDFYYRTYDMMIPQLMFAKQPNSDAVAVFCSMVPTFDPVQPKDLFQVVENERPEHTMLSNGSEFHFTFIIDRSGSMKRENRIQLAKDALSIFIRSLPKDSSFSIIGFGSMFTAMQSDEDQVIHPYNDDTRDAALCEISQMLANYGATNILEPLKFVQENIAKDSALKQRVFLLTDGRVDEKEQVIDYAAEHSNNTRIFTFGLGNGCDEALVR